MINEAKNRRRSYSISSDILISVPLLLHEITNELRDLIRSSVEREMTGIEDVDFGFRHIFAVSFWFTEIEREIVLTPDYQQTRLLLAHPRLPFRVGVDVCSIVVEKIALNVGLARLDSKSKTRRSTNPGRSVRRWDRSIMARPRCRQ